jgi:hypothetical protein
MGYCRPCPYPWLCSEKSLLMIDFTDILLKSGGGFEGLWWVEGLLQMCSSELAEEPGVNGVAMKGLKGSSGPVYGECASDIAVAGECIE